MGAHALLVVDRLLALRAALGLLGMLLVPKELRIHPLNRHGSIVRAHFHELD
jgi:hypothetical protein